LNTKSQIDLYIFTLGSLQSCTVLVFKYYHHRANILLYVDDMLIVESDLKKIKALKERLRSEFAIKDLGTTRQILRMRITKDRKDQKLWLSQEKYIEKVLQRVNMDKCKPVTSSLSSHFKLSHDGCPKDDKEKEKMKNVSYVSTVGSLMYAMVCTRPDITHTVGVVSHFLLNSGKMHWNTVKWIFRFLKGIINHYIYFGGTSNPVLEAYTDADWVGDIDSRKSTSGYLVCFGNEAVSWQSKLQKCVALSLLKLST
jgi:Reverse transcriptase (RNA-dependent DNA polymerase)